MDFRNKIGGVGRCRNEDRIGQSDGRKIVGDGELHKRIIHAREVLGAIKGV